MRDISTLPVVISLAFMALAIAQLATSRSTFETELPTWLAQLNLQDQNTIRAVLTVVIGGVFGIVVFAYTMVMNVINRAISNYSPRLLPLLIGKRYHQVVMGIGIGTIAHASILLLGVSAADHEIAQPPLLAAAVAVAFGLVTLTAYIYFVNRVYLGIHINKVLQQSYEQTRQLIKDRLDLLPHLQQLDESGLTPLAHVALRAPNAGYVAAIDLTKLARLSASAKTPLHLAITPGSFVQQHDVLLRAAHLPTDKLQRKAAHLIEVSQREPVEVYAVGLRHLVEVAIRAMGPSLNDPGTALTALHYLEGLLLQLRQLPDYNSFRQDGGEVRLMEPSYSTIRAGYLHELHTYLDQDPWTSERLRQLEVATAPKLA